MLHVKEYNKLALSNCFSIKRSVLFANPTYTLSLDCNIYNVTSISVFGVTASMNDYLKNKQYCQNFTNYFSISVDSKCSLSDKINSQVVSSCQNKTSCNVTIDTNSLQSNCTTSQNAFTDDFYISYNCFNTQLTFAGVKYTRPTWGMVVVIIDIVSMLILFITLVM